MASGGMGDIRGRVVITDAGSATLKKIQSGLHAVGQTSGRTTLGMFSGNLLQSAAIATDRLQRSMMALRTTLVGSSFALAGIIQTTRAFNESKFGYGFARITEFIKDGKLQLDEWKVAMNAAAKEARDKADSLGVSPDTTMRATEETEKLGFTGREAKSVRDSALGLHMSEPMVLDSGEAAKFLGAVLRGYEKQMLRSATSAGVDMADIGAVEEFKANWIKGLAAKAAVAGAESALGPADVVEGMRQFAPQWAAMGIPYEFALAALAHGANYGFRAPELGTAYKSLVNKTMNPTATGLRLISNLGVDRSKYLQSAPADPVKAVQRLNSLLDGQLFSGKGGKDRRLEWTRNLRSAYERGDMTSPEFQEIMTRRALKMLGKGWEGRADDVRQAVANATTVAGGDVDLPAYIKALREAGATIGDIAQIFEGRHVARNTPLFQFYDKLINLYEQLQGTDGTVIDAVTEGRKETEAGQTDALIGSLKNLVGALEDTGVVYAFKTAIDSLADAIRSVPSGLLAGLTAALLGIGAAGAGVAVLGRAIGMIKSVLVTSAGLAGAIASRSALGPVAAASGAAGAGGWHFLRKKGLKAGLKAGARWLPGVGLVLMGGGALYGGYQAWSKGGSAGDIAKESALGAIGLDGLSDAGEAGRDAPAATPGSAGPTGGGTASGLAALEAQAQQAASSIRATMNLDLTGEGLRAGQSFATGLAQGMQAAVAAAQSAAAQIRNAAGGVQLNTGPSMKGAN